MILSWRQSSDNNALESNWLASRQLNPNSLEDSFAQIGPYYSKFGETLTNSSSIPFREIPKEELPKALLNIDASSFKNSEKENLDLMKNATTTPKPEQLKIDTQISEKIFQNANLANALFNTTNWELRKTETRSNRTEVTFPAPDEHLFTFPVINSTTSKTTLSGNFNEELFVRLSTSTLKPDKFDGVARSNASEFIDGSNTLSQIDEENHPTSTFASSLENFVIGQFGTEEKEANKTIFDKEVTVTDSSLLLFPIFATISNVELSSENERFDLNLSFFT